MANASSIVVSIQFISIVDVAVAHWRKMEANTTTADDDYYEDRFCFLL